MGKQKNKEKQRLLELLSDKIAPLKFDDLIALGLGVWGALATKHPLGFASGLLGYKLARTNNLATGIVGLAMLGFTGLTAISQEEAQKLYDSFLPEQGKFPEWGPWRYR